MRIENQSHTALQPMENGGTPRRAYREGVLIERFYCILTVYDGSNSQTSQRIVNPHVFFPLSINIIIASVMPKHVPNFKHFLTTTQVNQPSEYREKSVNDLIAHSRIHQPLQRDSPTYIVRGERVWAPGAGIGGLPDVEDGGVHPYAHLSITGLLKEVL